MSDQLNKALVVSIIDYLTTLRQFHPDQLVDAENLDVALQCLSEATGLRVSDSETAAIKPPHSLPDIFNAGVAALSSSASSSSSVSPPRFDDFISALTSKGYFSGVAVGSPEYEQRLEQAKNKYAEKYPNAAPPPTSKPITAADKAAAEKLKAEGNAALSAGRLNDAYVKYTAAIGLNPTSSIYFANRAAVLINQSKYDEAIIDCRRAIECDGTYTKAYYRLGIALVGTNNKTEAKAAFERALHLCKDDPSMSGTIREQLARLNVNVDGDDDGVDGGAGGMDFSALLNNPEIANLFGGAAGAGAGGGGGMPDLNSLLNNSQLMQMAQSMFGGLGNNAAAATNAAQTANASGNATMAAAAAWGPPGQQPPPNPSSSGGGSSAFDNILNSPLTAQLQNDPDLAPVIADVRANGQSALFKHMGNPKVMSKLQSLIGPVMSQFGGSGRGGPGGAGTV